MPGNPLSKNTLKLKDQIEFQKKPKREWKVVKEFGTAGGGGNEGIALVELVGDPYDRYFIEKRFLPEHIKMGVSQKEMALLHQLGDHPNILKMVDHFIDGHRQKASVYLEYCDAGDLEKVLRGSKNNPVHERKIWNWFIGLMDALVYIHRGPKPEKPDRDVILSWNVIWHRDIKPPNILLKTDREKSEVVAKLADFGFSESVHMAYEHKSKNQIAFSEAYTPGFEPPEHPKYSGATDVWQLSLTIACVCTGTLVPWSLEQPNGTKWDRKRPAGPYYSRELNDILAWCLNDNKSQRPKPMDIAKCLKDTWPKVRSRLLPDLQPLVVPGKVEKPVANAPNASSPGPRGAAQKPGYQDRRPGFPNHAFSDPEMQRMGQRDEQYGNLVQAQRNPMSPQSVAEVMCNRGGPYDGSPHGRPPGGFNPFDPESQYRSGYPRRPDRRGGYQFDPRMYHGSSEY